MRKATPFSIIAATAILLAAISLCLLAEGSIAIASWNVKNFWGDDDHSSMLAEVIARYDLIALQEIKSREGMEELLQVLNREGEQVIWDVVRSPILGEGNAAEYYAFVYRIDKVQHVAGSQGVYPEMTSDDFSRPPFFATFNTVDEAFVFTLITIHVTWGSLPSLRTAECHHLVFVWDYVQALEESENDLILLGDFNRDKPTHGAFTPLRQRQFEQLVTARDIYTTYSTSPDDPTGHWYDQIWIDPRYTSEDTTGSTGVYRLHEDYYLDAEHPHLEVRTNISDHLPIWAEFYTGRDTDLPRSITNPPAVRFGCVDPQGETFTVINPSAVLVDLSGYRVTDNEGSYIFPQGILLQPGDSIEVGFDEYNRSGSTQGLYLNDRQDEVLIYAPGVAEPIDSCQWSLQSARSCACDSPASSETRWALFRR